MNAQGINARKTQEQRRAYSAWEQVGSVSKPLQKEYGSLARGLPAMIQTNGLGQTLAFLMSKGEAYNLLYQHLSNWLGGELHGDAQDENFLIWLVAQNTPTYQRATTEALAFALWLRRFVEAQGWTDSTAPSAGELEPDDAPTA